MSNLRTAALLILAMLANPPLQDDDQAILAIARINSTLTFAYRHLEKKKDDLELVDDQTKKLKALRLQHFAVMGKFKKLTPSERGDSSVISEFLKSMQNCEESLAQDVLLPHQIDALRIALFSKHLKLQKGNFLRTLQRYYPDILKLTEGQIDSLNELEEATDKKIAEARKQFEAEIKKIAQEARRKIEEKLTAEQIEVLGKLQPPNSK